MPQVVDYLGEQFKSTNQTMLRILSVKDAVNELHEVNGYGENLFTFI